MILCVYWMIYIRIAAKLILSIIPIYVPVGSQKYGTIMRLNNGVSFAYSEKNVTNITKTFVSAVSDTGKDEDGFRVVTTNIRENN